MARAKKNQTDDGDLEILPGTQEFATREHFAKEKAAYEERTGETVNYELDAPLTSTPLSEVVATESTETDEIETAKAEGEG